MITRCRTSVAVRRCFVRLLRQILKIGAPQVEAVWEFRAGLGLDGSPFDVRSVSQRRSA